MPSLLPGFEYDIFISYRQKDNKGDRWVSEFVESLRTELESTFKEEISVYFDISPHDGLLETHDVDASLKEKLKCLIFIPIISRTYCDPKSFAWEHEFKAFIDQASKDQFGLKVKLPTGNVATRILPIQIHDLYPEDKAMLEKELGGVLRAIEFIYREPGINKPLNNEDDEKRNLNNTKYRLQVNKVANAIDEIIHCLKGKETLTPDRKVSSIPPAHGMEEHNSKEASISTTADRKSRKLLIIGLAFFLLISGVFAIYKLIRTGNHSQEISKPDKSIAVLPFVNDSPDTNNLYFCNGMMEEILNQLQKIGDLRVKARTTSEKYRNPKRDITEIGKELKVSLIMEGSVRKIGDDLRIATQLIDAKTGDHLWSEVYDGKYTTEIFEFQSNVAKKVAASLNAVITPQETKKIDTKSTTYLAAHDLYMRGHEMIRKFRYTNDSTFSRSALNYFDQALQIDPNYTEALHGKGMTFVEIKNYDSAMFYYKKILDIDHQNSSGLGGIGRIYMETNKPDSALKYFQKAIAFNPDDPFYYLAMGQLYINYRHQVIKALPYYQKAYDLGGDSWAEINEAIGWVYYQIGYYSKAIRYMKNALSLRSECAIVNRTCIMFLAQGNFGELNNFLDSVCNITMCENVCDMIRFYSYSAQGKYIEAEKYFNKAKGEGYTQTVFDDVYIACLFKETGRNSDALFLLNKSIKRDRELNMQSSGLYSKLMRLQLAAYYAILGENKKSMEYLSELENEGIFEYPITLKTFPGFDNLRKNPEFKTIVKRVEDEKATLRAQVKEMEKRGEIDL
jgi:TolB-like protein/Tfp pilus assembly protein PilF